MPIFRLKYPQAQSHPVSPHPPPHCGTLCRWMGRLKHIINSMCISTATFYIHRMVWLHNERSIEEVCCLSFK